MVGDSTQHQAPSSTQRLIDELSIEQGAVDELTTLSDLSTAIDATPQTDIEARGEAIRADVAGNLDVSALDEELTALERRLERLPDGPDSAVPEGDRRAESLYRDLIAPARRAQDQLVDAGFFEALEEHMPRFTSEHIQDSANELLSDDTLADHGFDTDERTALLLDLATNETRLSRWVPTRDIPSGVEFNVDYVPPLYQRATGGAVLWINALDRHLWQSRILLTDQILEDARWHTKAILGAFRLFLTAARSLVAEDGPLTEREATAAILGAGGLLIVHQEDLMKDVFWITDEDRAESDAR